jgi:hypothetical protein
LTDQRCRYSAVESATRYRIDDVAAAVGQGVALEALARRASELGVISANYEAPGQRQSEPRSTALTKARARGNDVVRKLPRQTLSGLVNGTPGPGGVPPAGIEPAHAV